MMKRPRRLRRSPALREALAETRLHKSRLVQPHFVVDGEAADDPVETMPGIARMSIPRLVEQVGADLELGVSSVLLFGVTEDKDERATAATAPDGVVPRAVKALREAYGDKLVIMTDVCLCGAMWHGHCGVMEDGNVLNDESLPLL